MSGNFLQIDRDIIRTPMWLGEKFTRGQAWLDLVLLANWASGHVRIRGVRVDLSRGQLAGSSVFLAGRWRWSRTKVSTFLNELERDQQIRQQINNLTNVITITRYDTLHKEDSRLGSRNAPEVQQTGQQKDTQEEEQEEEEEEARTTKRAPKYSDGDVSTAQWMLGELRAAIPGFTAPRNLDKWANSVRLIRERDGKTDSDIRGFFDWANSHEQFWRGTVKCPDSLRKNWNTIAGQMQRNPNNGKSRPTGPGHIYDPAKPIAESLAQR